MDYEDPLRFECAYDQNDAYKINRIYRDGYIPENSTSEKIFFHSVARWILRHGIAAAEMLVLEGFNLDLVAEAVFNLLYREKPNSKRLRQIFRMFSSRWSGRNSDEACTLPMAYAFLCSGPLYRDAFFEWMEFAMRKGYPFIEDEKLLVGLTVLSLAGVYDYIEHFVDLDLVNGPRIAECMQLVGAAQVLNIGKAHRQWKGSLHKELESGLNVWHKTAEFRWITENWDSHPYRYGEWRSKFRPLMHTKILAKPDELLELDPLGILIQALLIVERHFGAPWHSSLPDSQLMEVLSRVTAILKYDVRSTTERVNTISYLVWAGIFRVEFVAACLTELGTQGFLNTRVQDLQPVDISYFTMMFFDLFAPDKVTNTMFSNLSKKLSVLCDKVNLPKLESAKLEWDELSSLLHLGIVSWLSRSSGDVSFYEKLIKILCAKGAFPGHPRWFLVETSLELTESQDMPDDIVKAMIANICCFPNPIDARNEVLKLRCLSARAAHYTLAGMSVEMKQKLIKVTNNVYVPLAALLRFHTHLVYVSCARKQYIGDNTMNDVMPDV